MERSVEKARAPKVSTVDRLRKLPVVFSLADVARLGLSGPAMHVFLARASQKGLVKSAGNKSGIFYNLLRDERANQQVLQAARLAYPSAVVVGGAVLHAAGWTTQVFHTIDVAILKRPSNFTIHGVNFVQRSRRWYRERAPDIVSAERSEFGVAALTPAGALLDLLEMRDAPARDLWVPDNDDIEQDLAAEGLKERVRRMKVSP